MGTTQGTLSKRIALLLLAIGLFSPVVLFAQTAPQSDKESLQQQLDALQKEIDGLDTQLVDTQKEKETLARQVTLYDIEIKKRQLEINRLSLEIRKAESEITSKNKNLTSLSQKIEKIRESLQANMLQYYQQNRASLIEALLSYSSLSQFFDSINNLESIQAEMHSSLADLRSTRVEVQEERDSLQEFKEGQAALKSLQELERRTIEQNKKEKDELLRLTKGKEALFQQILSQKKKNLAALKNQLFYLERTGVSAEDALKYAKLAADRTGIRVEFLLALLEVETGRQFEGGVITAGTHIGTGNWRTDLYNCYISLGKRTTAENQKTAFFKITDELGLDPDKMPVSRKYANGAGCGGAMGPAQFMPSTWLLFENRVAKLTGNDPANPWNVEDAFTASALYLADAGATAKTEAAERRAAQAYISGRPSCPASGPSRTVCRNYSSQIVSLTKEIAKNIN